MTIFSARELLQFPSGDNSSDVLINNIHFNRTALNYFNYTLYSNGTLSNNTNCWLTFDLYQPSMLANGTFLNGTSCYAAIDGIGDRGISGIAFATMFALTIMFTLINLRKHGRQFLPAEKRWRAVGRRWQWYWMLFTATCGTISCFMSIDVDRNYLQSIAIVLQSFFYYLMLPGLMAAIWEGVRHWGSWQERQICDRDCFAFQETSSREKQEFYLPLVFYLFAWLNFFMVIPRGWTAIEKQRSQEQALHVAKPSATDDRFKAGSILAIICLFIICYSLEHSIYRYRERPSSILGNALFYLNQAPSKFLIVIILLGVRVGYGVASAFLWSISPLKYNVNAGWLYGLGYAPALLILIVLNIYGYIDENEDRLLIGQRVERGRIIDAELGIGPKKPSWWRRVRDGDNPFSGDRLKAFTHEIGGGQPTQRNLESYVEMGNMRVKHYADDEDGSKGDGFVPVEGPHLRPGQDPFRDEPTSTNLSKGETLGAGGDHTEPRQPSYAGTASSNESNVSQAPQQRIRSMLDI